MVVTNLKIQNMYQPAYLHQSEFLLLVPTDIHQKMFHRTIHSELLHRTMMTKYGGIDSQSMCPSFDKKSTTQKRNSKSMLSWDATTFLILALLIRAIFLMLLTPWFSKVTSFELKPMNSKHLHTLVPLKVELSNKHNGKTSMVLFATMTDFFSTTETARKTLTNDEILSGASKTTQLLLQVPPRETIRQRGFEDATNKQLSVPMKERTLYDILGTVPTATKEELKRQYIAMAKLTHPDALISQQRNGNNVELFPDFTEVADAYQILSNPVERKKYDRTLRSTEIIQVMVLLGDICIGTTLTVAEITSAIVWITLMIILQPIAVHVTTELFYLSIDDSGSLSN